MVRYLSLVTVALAIVQLSIIGSLGDDVSNSYNISQSSNTESIKIGNTKTKNYNIHESNYLPTQLTQVVLNVPKIKNKLRKSRPPTVEEFAIKRKIIDVYDEAKSGSHLHMNHLGLIIQALNPKYIATDRVRRVAFTDPRDPMRVEAPYEELEGPLVLRLESGSMGEQLDLVSQKFREQVVWNQDFIQELSNTSDEVLSPEQSAFKRLILCLSHPTLCNLLANKEPSSYTETEYEPNEIESIASETNNVYRTSEPEFNVQTARGELRDDDDAPVGGYNRYTGDRTYEPVDYEQNIMQPASPSIHTFNPPPSAMVPQHLMVPQNNPGLRVVHQKSRFLPRLRNLRFSDQQSRPRILNHLTKQPTRSYQRY